MLSLMCPSLLCSLLQIFPKYQNSRLLKILFDEERNSRSARSSLMQMEREIFEPHVI